jgi:hypothetical protein
MMVMATALQGLRERIARGGQQTGDGHVVTLKGRPYAVGLDWFELGGNPGVAALRQQAVDHARRPEVGASVFATRISGMFAQFGVGHASLGHRPGMRALADGVAQGMARDYDATKFILAARLPVGGGREDDSETAADHHDRWWVLAVLDGVVEAGGDRVASSEDEAQAIFSDLQSAIGGSANIRMFVPPSWALPGSDGPVDIHQFAGLGIALRPVQPVWSRLLGRAPGPSVETDEFGAPVQTRTDAGRVVLLLGSIVILGGGGLFYWWSVEQAEQRRQEQIIAQRLHEYRKAINAPKPWEEAPWPTSVAASCRGVVEVTPVFIAGWDLESLSCNFESGHLVGAYRRTPVGRLGEAVAQAERMGATVPPIHRGTEFRMARPMDLTRAQRRGATSLLPRSATYVALFDVVEALGFDLDLSWSDPPPPPRVPVLPEGTPPPPPPPPWPGHFSVSMDVSGSLEAYAKTLEAIPGFVLTHATYDLETFRWRFDGQVYAWPDETGS